MKSIVFALALAATALPFGAAAQDMAALARDGIGLPLKLRDAVAGPWTLQSGKRTVCVIALSADQVRSGVYGLVIAPDCGSVLPAGIIGWKPVTDGMALVGADTRTLVDFNQWTPKDLAAPQPGAPTLELTRR
jgi:hypothetical protein